MTKAQVAVDQLAAALVGLPVTHVWQGYGTAIFLEFGALKPAGRRADGSERNAAGSMGIGIEWSWRIEKRASILCGSSENNAKLASGLASLIGSRIEAVAITGRLPELSVSFSNGLHLATFMTAKGQPDWTIFDRRTADISWLTVRRGRVVLERPISHGEPY